MGHFSTHSTSSSASSPPLSPQPTMKCFLVCALFLVVLLCSSSTALADTKTDGTVLVAAAQPATNLVSQKTITLTQQAAPERKLAEAVVLTTTVPTVIPTMVAVRTPVAFIGFASSASSLTPFSFW